MFEKQKRQQQKGVTWSKCGLETHCDWQTTKNQGPWGNCEDAVHVRLTCTWPGLFPSQWVTFLLLGSHSWARRKNNNNGSKSSLFVSYCMINLFWWNNIFLNRGMLQSKNDYSTIRFHFLISDKEKNKNKDVGYKARSILPQSTKKTFWDGSRFA